MFKEIIDILLEKKANLNADKEAELNEFKIELDIKYQEREEKINKMLDDAGYEEPVEEEVEQVENQEVIAEVETTPIEWR